MSYTMELIPEMFCLTPAQAKAVFALAAGAKGGEACKLAGVDRSTQYQWSKHDANFIAALRFAQKEFILILHEEMCNNARQRAAKLFPKEI